MPSRAAATRSSGRRSPTNRASIAAVAARAGGRAARAAPAGSGRGVRWPKKAPACTIVEAVVAGRVASPSKSSKSAPFSITVVRCRRRSGAADPAPRAIAPVAATARRAAAHRARHPRPRPPAWRARRLARSGGAGSTSQESRKSATHGRRVAAAIASRDQVRRVGRRGRQDHVDLVPARDPDARRDGRRHPGRRLVGHQGPLVGVARLDRQPGEAAAAGQRILAERCSGAEEPRTVDDGVVRDLREQRLVAGEPLRIVGRQHVHLDPELGEVLAELQRPLHAAAAGGREVERHEQGPHPRDDRRCGARYGAVMRLPEGFVVVSEATPFERRVHRIVKRIPAGMVASYGRIAEWAGAAGGGPRRRWHHVAQRRRPARAPGGQRLGRPGAGVGARAARAAARGGRADQGRPGCRSDPVVAGSSYSVCS